MHRTRRSRCHPSPALACIGLAIAAVSLPATSRAAAMFTGLGDLPGGTFSSTATGVSADGSVVVGVSSGASGTEAFRWTAGGGMVGLGDLPDGGFESVAYGVSADGAVVVGRGRSTPGGGTGEEAFRWTSGTGMVGLGNLSAGYSLTQANAVSADGSVLVGLGYASGSRALRWTSGSGFVDLGDLPGGGSDSQASGVSGDGAVVVGFGNGASGREAFRWTAGGGMVGLGDLPGGGFDSAAFGVSADGSVVVGYGKSASGYEAFRWTAAGGMMGLGDLAGGGFSSGALDVSVDGSVVVGEGVGPAGGEAFVWTAGGGMRSVKDLLETDYGLSLTGWTLTSARAISADGFVITGWGLNPSGHIEAWITVIPEPSTALLLAVGLVGMARLERRRHARSNTRRRPGARRVLSARIAVAIVLPIAAGMLAPSTARSLGISPDPFVVTDLSGEAFSFDFIGVSVGVPTGGVVLDGSVGASDTSFLFRATLLGPTGTNVLPFVPAFASGWSVGVGTIPGPDLDVLGAPAASHPAFKFASGSIGTSTDLVFIATASVAVGDWMEFYTYSPSPAAVITPEPSTALLLAAGLVGLAFRRARA